MHDDKNPNQLVVEDNDLKLAIAYLMRQRIKDWPAKGSESAPVYIRPNFSADEVLNHTFLGTMFKFPNLEALGVVVDADEKFESRWSKISAFARAHCKDTPKSCPASGLIVQASGGKRFGAWIMPDNQSAGMLETFCRSLIPDKTEALWSFAEGATNDARSHGADYRDVHRQKAHIHTWLSWRDPPGENIGTAIAKRLLDPHARGVQPFLDWFKTLYRLTEK